MIATLFTISKQKSCYYYHVSFSWITLLDAWFADNWEWGELQVGSQLLWGCCNWVVYSSEDGIFSCPSCSNVLLAVLNTSLHYFVIKSFFTHSIFHLVCRSLCFILIEDIIHINQIDLAVLWLRLRDFFSFFSPLEVKVTLLQ